MSAELSMPTYAFNTLAYANKLKSAGLEPEIAEAQAQLQAEVLSDITNNSQLATKHDLQELRVKNDKLDSELNRKIDKLDSKIDKLEVELSGKIDKLEVELNGKIDKLAGELMVKLGGIIIASTSILGILIAFVSRAH